MEVECCGGFRCDLVYVCTVFIVVVQWLKHTLHVASSYMFVVLQFLQIHVLPMFMDDARYVNCVCNDVRVNRVFV